MKKGPFKMKGMTFKESPAKISEESLLSAAKNEALARTSAKVQKGMADSRKTHLFGLQAAMAGLESAIPGLDKLDKKRKKKKEEKEEAEHKKAMENPVGDTEPAYDNFGEKESFEKNINEGTELNIIETDMGGSSFAMRKQDTVFPMKYGRRKKKK
jgi:hypothetical protein